MKRYVRFAGILCAAAILPAGLAGGQETQPTTGGARGGVTASTGGRGEAAGTSSAAAPARGTSGRGGRSTFSSAGGFGGTTGGGGFGGFSGGASSGGGGAGAETARPAVATEGPTCAFTATIYEVRIPLEQVGRVDVDALTKAAGTPADFEKSLAELGEVHPVYFVSQSVRVAGDKIVIGTQVPYITNSQIIGAASGGGGARGAGGAGGGEPRFINSVSYSQMGAAFNLAGAVTASGNLNVDLSIEVSTKSEGTTKISDKVNAPNFRRASMSRKGPVQPRQPFVVMSVDAGSMEAGNKAIAYVARVIVGVPQGQ